MPAIWDVGFVRDVNWAFPIGQLWWVVSTVSDRDAGNVDVGDHYGRGRALKEDSLCGGGEIAVRRLGIRGGGVKV